MKWHTQERDPEGLRRVVRNGQVPAWRSPVVWDAGSAGASGQRPAVDEHGERCPLASRILPPYPCRSPKVAEALLVRHLRGLSTGAVRPALETLLGEGRCGILSATNIGRLTAVCGMLRGVAAVSQAQPGWMPVGVRMGEGGAIRYRSQTELDTLRLSIWFSPNYARDPLPR
jgi:hypothetical protein